MATRPDRLLFLLSRVLGGKTFSGQLMAALESVPGVRPHFVFLEEEDYGRHADKVPAANRLSGTYIGPEILRWKLRADPPPPCDAVFVQSFELLPACDDLDPRIPAVLAHDSTNLLSYRLIRDQRPSWSAAAACWGKSLLTHSRYARALGRVKAFLPRTRWCAESLVRDFGVDPSRIRVTPAGLDTAWWCPSPEPRKEEPPVLLFVGDDFERKGGPFLVDLFARYIHPRARLRIVSRHPGLKGRSLPPGVEWLPNFGPGRRLALLEVFRTASIFVFPTRKEHMGLVLAEAAAAGLPMVATGVGGTSQIVRHGENGFLMPYDAGAGDWAKAILDLLADSPRRLRFGRAARALAEREFSREALRGNVEWALETASRGMPAMLQESLES